MHSWRMELKGTIRVICLQAKESQGLQQIPAAGGKALDRLPLTASEGTSPADSFQNSTTVRQHTSVVEATQLVLLCHRSPRKPTHGCILPDLLSNAFFAYSL